MANFGVVGELAVEIKAKLGDFKKQLTEAEQATERSGKKMEESFTRVNKQVGGLFTTLRGIAALGGTAAAGATAALGFADQVLAAGQRESLARSRQAVGNAQATLGLGQQIALARAGRTLNPFEQSALSNRFAAINQASAAGLATREQAIQELGLGGGLFSAGTLSIFARQLRGFGLSSVPNAIDLLTGANTSIPEGLPTTLTGQFNARTGRQATAGRSLILGASALTSEQNATAVGGFVDPGALIAAQSRLIEAIEGLRSSFEARNP